MNAPQITVVQPDPRAPLDRFEGWLTDAGATLRLVDPAVDGVPESAGDGVIILGGTDNCRSYPWLTELHASIRSWLSAEVPVLGICLGHQILADALDGDIAFGLEGEHGPCEIELMPAGLTDPLFSGLTTPLTVAQHHHDVVSALPDGAALLAASQRYEIQAFRIGSAVGLQFHPEASPATMCAWTPADAEAMIRRMEAVDEAVAATGRTIARNFVQMCR